MPRKVHLEQTITTLSTKTNLKSDKYYELLVVDFNPATRKIKCKITEKIVSAGSSRDETFEGKFRRKQDDTRLVAIMREVDFGNAQMRLIITAHESHALKDRIRVVPSNLGNLLDGVESTFASVPVVMTDDPDMESFTRQGIGVSAPIAGSTTTTPQTGAIQPGTVIVKDAAQVIFAYDVPTSATVGKLKSFVTDLDVGDVKYDAPWNVTNLTSSTYSVEALRNS